MWRVYQSQKADEKRNAANVILLEIEGAEDGLRKVNVTKPFSDDGDVILMRTASWDKYKHLFVADFVNYRNEWDKIAEFYALCENYDKAVASQNETIEDNKRELISNVQRVLAGYADQRAAELAPDRDDFKDEEKREALERRYRAKRQRFMDVTVGIVSQAAQIDQYIPKKFNMDANRSLDAIDKNLSTSTAGMRLRELAAPRKSILKRLGLALKRQMA